MATPLVSNSAQGYTLVEVLLAASIGVIAISTIGAVFISAQRVADEKSQQLYLLQALSSTFQTIEEDIQRAGFDNYHGQSLMLDGASQVIELHNSADFGLAYYRPMSDGKNYRSVRYYLDGEKLVVCEQGASSKEGIKSRLAIASCRSMLDEKRIHITAFSMVATPLSSATASSAIYRLRLSAHTSDSLYMRTLEVDVKQRNWQ
ncbi:PulJ/GspJ family protein [Vibrio panuliri]|uniref:Pilus assembly protein PilW n=1 Tax=Vibrio panuliri TaxID=1381081 RepID=A0A1Q9HP71_9VIBR|nr:hypothetical protein [Vibrio panuliri]OLQ92673.1 hypothetical protein BIY22_15225 [Vibrio panuliri]OLQ94832.1 hypothetical protein BIY20_00640 [Vibrio panuliri]